MIIICTTFTYLFTYLPTYLFQAYYDVGLPNYAVLALSRGDAITAGESRSRDTALADDDVIGHLPIIASVIIDAFQCVLFTVYDNASDVFVTSSDRIVVT